MLNVGKIIGTFIYNIVVNFYNKTKNVCVCVSMSNKSVKFYAIDIDAIIRTCK